ncbi:LytTR family DNA-binding domain-containing protein [Tenacibaculum finnmarkense]|uniref:LytR/AlgR family response regulator transcription factor n=1 Tax=Tenacibaculum finnmarkense TaxID=2781243 RepID=UPI00187B1292|nr:LytTR family DNA-binding domain-containing protein [Tenacibaculum finnmarkense]MBE7647944.1 response regulator [Tenacibaculum finnmarkense genomovar ulcerans]MBE7688229.1 response regulator [Tenacibaculum finnmarkense genomovar ulcerans]MCD8400039.1 LytTR family DNA-binding domain-containing protein [Tenacibaculum finnmarkense genomovar ulcerans]MCD8422756.1 LytTR family DNA-binding domain-containing protein [Tenacibaculum finnmarkense genomovar ulcerans]MCD8432647.1 LytTR family DNA-bindin
MNVIIIEDEKPAARRLKRMLSELNIEAQTMLHSVEESINWFQNNKHPDLIFLDIQLSDGLSFEIFEEIEVKSAIIFTTAYDQYALKAFKLNSIDYLLKPLDQDELKVAVDKFKEHQPKKSDVKVNIDAIRKLLVNPVDRKFKKRFTIKVGQHIKMIPIDQIVCLYSENKATYIHTNANRNYLIDNSLEYWQEHLNPEYFFRVNRTFIIHINAIKDIISYTNSRLQLMLHFYDESEIIVSRERVKAFKNWID